MSIYDRYTIVVTRDSDQRLLKMFVDAFENLSKKEKENAPVVVNR